MCKYASESEFDVVTKLDVRTVQRKQKIRKRHQQKALRRTKPAFIRALNDKETAKRIAIVERKLRQERQLLSVVRPLASDITNHIVGNGGEIYGKSLRSIYKRLGQQFGHDTSTVELAVAHACHLRWLERHEEHIDESDFVFAYTVPELAPAA